MVVGDPNNNVFEKKECASIFKISWHANFVKANISETFSPNWNTPLKTHCNDSHNPQVLQNTYPKIADGIVNNELVSQTLLIPGSISSSCKCYHTLLFYD